MGAMTTVHVQVGVEVQKRAAEVLQREGLTIEQAVERMLTVTADEGVCRSVIASQMRIATTIGRTTPGSERRCRRLWTINLREYPTNRSKQSGQVSAKSC
jgi:hypothetical protein